MRFSRTFAVLSLVAACPCFGVTLSAGNHQVQAAAGQTITIRISGGESIQAIQLLVAVQTGGPVPTGMDLKTGAVLAESAFTPDPVYIDGNQIYADYSMHFGGEAVADGIAATVTLDASGLTPGSVYTVALQSDVATSTVVASTALTTTLESGTITIAGAPSGGGGGTPPSPPTDPTPPPVTPSGDPVTEPVAPEEPAGPDTPTDNTREPDPVITPGAEPGPVPGGSTGSDDLDSEEAPTLAPRLPGPGTCAAGIVEGLVMSLLGLCVLRRKSD